MIQFAIDMGDKEIADKAYEEVIKWFKDTYELKRKVQQDATKRIKEE